MLDQELEELDRLADEDGWLALVEDKERQIGKLEAQLKAQAYRIEALEKALKPFAEAAIRHYTDDNGGGNRQMTLVLKGEGTSPIEYRNDAAELLQKGGGGE